MPFLEKCPSQGDVYSREVCLRVVSTLFVLEESPSNRGAYVRVVSILESCPLERDTCLRKVFILEMGPSY